MFGSIMFDSYFQFIVIRLTFLVHVHHLVIVDHNLGSTGPALRRRRRCRSGLKCVYPNTAVSISYAVARWATGAAQLCRCAMRIVGEWLVNGW